MPLDIGTETYAPTAPRQTTETTLDTPLVAGATATYTLPLSITGGGVIANTDISSATLTLVDEETKVIVNGRQNQDIRGLGTGANDVAISSIATLVWSLQPLDTKYIDPSKTKRLEWHRAIFTINYDTGGGSETLIHTVRFPVLRPFLTEV
jgi:hypothetical protein